MPSTEFEQIVLAGADDHDLTKLSEYEKVGGYQSLRKALGMERQAVLDELITASVRGRGGAGFPSGRKASFVPKPEQTTKPIYLTINADESEPGTFKDREIMARVPHRLIEGALITAYTIGSNAVFIYIRGEYLTEYEIVKAALDEARDRGLVGANIAGSSWNCTIVLHRGAGAYICGEETALLESLEGKRGQPRSKPPFPAIAGLYAAPTLINNVETIATVPAVIARGGAWYSTLGVENANGTRVFSLSGNVVNGGNYELPLGISLREVIYDIGGGIPNGRTLKAIIPGGSSTPILRADQIDTALDYDSVAAGGSMLGSGGIIAIDDRACMVQVALRVASFYQHESCGKCTPCREGTRWLVSLITKIEAGQGSNADLDLLVDVCGRIMGRSLCPLGDAAAMPISSYVERFREEFQAHIDQGCCPYGDQSSLDGILGPVQQAARMHRQLAVIA